MLSTGQVKEGTVKKRLEIEDILSYRFLSSLKASADKKHCVFNVHHANIEKNGYDSALYLYDAETCLLYTSRCV